LIVVDALSSWIVRPALDKGQLPTLRQLIDNGQVHWQCTSVFPSLTPAATSAICTGCYPSDHGIFGAFYFDRDADRVRFYGTDFWVILNKRFRNFFNEFLRSLNQEFMTAETIFERLEDDAYTCASLNFLIFRGRQLHTATTPWTLRLWPGVPSTVELNGPEVLCLGDFVSRRTDRPQQPRFSGPGGIFHRYGFTDPTTARQLMQLVQQGLPDFTLAYFPDNDFDSHSAGPEQALTTLQRVDRQLADVAEAAGGLDRLLNETAVVITGDHSQSRLDADPVGVDLSKVLSDYRQVDAGRPWQDGEELMICPNLRAAQIYLRREYELQQADVIERLLNEPGIDQVIERRIHGPDDHRYLVHTSDRGQLEFWAADAVAGRVEDSFGGYWNFRGELKAVDAEVTKRDKLVYGDYPNALERVAHSFDRQFSGDLWATVRLGHEVCDTSGRPNQYGSHGSLHQLDSTSPLIVAGVQQSIDRHESLRIVDVAPLCLSLLGTHVDRPVGHSYLGSVSGVSHR
jgi:hypothetical protein